MPTPPPTAVTPSARPISQHPPSAQQISNHTTSAQPSAPPFVAQPVSQPRSSWSALRVLAIAIIGLAAAAGLVVLVLELAVGDGAGGGVAQNGAAPTAPVPHFPAAAREDKPPLAPPPAATPPPASAPTSLPTPTPTTPDRAPATPAPPTPTTPTPTEGAGPETAGPTGGVEVISRPLGTAVPRPIANGIAARARTRLATCRAAGEQRRETVLLQLSGGNVLQSRPDPPWEANDVSRCCADVFAQVGAVDGDITGIMFFDVRLDPR
jgi:hypothetical protein